MLHLNSKKLKAIKNKTIPSPLRPKFRNKTQANIYFLSHKRINNDKKNRFFKNLKLITFITIILVGGYFLSN